MTYEAAETAYQERRFGEALNQVEEHLKDQPDDLRALLLRGYIQFFGFENKPAAAGCYSQVLALAGDGPYRQLAEDGLSQCGIQGAEPAPDPPKPEEVEPAAATPWLGPVVAASTPLAEAAALLAASIPEAEEPGPNQKPLSNAIPGTTGSVPGPTAEEVAELARGWIWVDLTSPEP
ncbi:MAG: hypothetical protein EBU30_04005 [Synechococcaceae bacterium WB6_3B_236]|nr:hypothetical protein [Synechococcaceae bacterium WB6_3B_236]